MCGPMQWNTNYHTLASLDQFGLKLSFTSASIKLRHTHTYNLGKPRSRVTLTKGIHKEGLVTN